MRAAPLQPPGARVACSKGRDMKDQQMERGLFDLTGKVAIITGAAQGMGASHARRFVAEGARVIATDLSGAALRPLTSLGVETHVLDVTDGKAVAEIAALAGTPDILFNCAGFVHAGCILECDEKDFDFSVELNVV